MIYHTIADILVANESAQDRFVAAVAGLTEAQESYRAEEGRWTMAEIVEHVSIVNDGFLRITHKLLKQAEEKGAPAAADLNLGDTSLDENGRQPPPFQAPDRVHPQGGVRVADSLQKLSQTLVGFAEVRPRIEAVDCSQENFPHPAFGPINLYKWLVLYGEHEDRHRGQIEQIKAAPGFPS
jgi:uncharacterized damage-inducible protein DinB